MKPTEFIVETSQIAQEADDMHADHEVQMARSDCYSAAKYAIELHRMLKEISEQQGLDGWVSEKITLANDYLRTVHEYLMHEMAHGQEQAMMGFTAEAAEYAFDKMLSEVGQKTMSRAAKGHEKYGKEGMQALAKAGREGASEKKLDTIRDQHNKYDDKVDEAVRGVQYSMSGMRPPESQEERDQIANRIKGQRAANRADTTVTGYGNRVKSQRGAASGGGVTNVQTTDNQGQSAYSGKDIDPKHAGYAGKLKIPASAGKRIAEMATGGGSSSGGIATSMGGPGHKPTSGVPKKVSNAHKSKKVAVGKGVY